MKSLTQFLAQALVEHPEQVRVSETRHGGRVHLELQVAREDMGRVIGKGGRVANALRTLLRVAAEREGIQVNLDVLEP